MYLSSVRTGDERFTYSDPPRQMDRIEDVLRAILSLRERVRDQLRRQESIGLAQNLHTLAEAESSFNSVFTTGFCFKVRDDVRTGLTTLAKLNRELKNIQVGYDTYVLEWDWVPQFKQYYDFFDAVDGIRYWNRRLRPADATRHRRLTRRGRGIQGSLAARTPTVRFYPCCAARAASSTKSFSA